MYGTIESIHTVSIPLLIETRAVYFSQNITMKHKDDVEIWKFSGNHHANFPYFQYISRNRRIVILVKLIAAMCMIYFLPLK